MSRGRYIVLEGGDRVGKTTQCQNLVDYLFDRRGVPVRNIREPGGSEEGELLRQLVKDESINLTPTQQALMHNGARIIMLATVVKPILDMGSWVVSDRSYLSTIVYQGHAQGEDLPWLRKITAVARQVLEPDLIILLDGEPERMRIRRSDVGTGDRYDNLDKVFHESVQQGYRKEAFAFDHPMINADDTEESVFAQIKEVLAKRFEEVK